MCLVSICPKGTKKKSDEVVAFIKKGFSSNKDGSGYMFKKDGSNEVTIVKGFFNIDELLKSIDSQDLQEDDELVIHHRISTAGLVSKENTHPFVCSNKHEEVKAVQITVKKPCLAHNGMFSGLSKFESKNPDFSDTYAFARYIMGDKDAIKIFNRDIEAFEIFFDRIISSSRIAILSPDKDLITLGNFTRDNGYLHSNSGYKEFTINRGGIGYDWYNSQHRSAYNVPAINGPRNSSCELNICIDKNRPSVPDTLDPALSKLLFAPSGVLMRRFTYRNLEITYKNAHHFNFIKKITYDTYINKENVKVFTCYDEYDDKLINMTIEEVRNDSIYNFDTITRRELISEYYYVPKSIYCEMYNDYYKLITSVMDIGKKTIKKLNDLILKKSSSKIDDKVFYPKIGLPICKGALMLYRDWLEDAAAEVYGDNVIDAIPVIDSIDDEISEDETNLDQRYKEFMESYD